MARWTNRVGQIFPTNNGDVRVIEYNGCNDIVVEFLDTGTRIHTRISNVKTKNVYDPFNREKHFGVGYFGIGKYSQGYHRFLYSLWKAILIKAYSASYKEANPTYEMCSMYKGWWCFQDFAEYVSTLKNYDISGFDFDKDLIKLGNKNYHPKYCSFVPNKVNKLLTLRENVIKTTGLPMGVSKLPSGNYVTHLAMYGKYTHIGTFTTIKSAQRAYAETRCKYVKTVAKQYREDLDERVYNTLNSIKPSYFLRK